MMKKTTAILALIFLSTTLLAQPWLQDDVIFNPSGIPSLPFSQPRVGDLDGDGDFDLILGSIDQQPMYFENIGSISEPAFAPGVDLFLVVEPLDAEVGVVYDLDDDGDLDFVCGGFTGLNLYLNIGIAQTPEFAKIENFFAGLAVGQNPIPDFTDLDNDGDADMVLGFSESGLVKIYLNSGTAVVAQFTEDDSYEIADVGLYAYPVFGDVDGDEDQDLLVGKDSHGFAFYRNDGDVNNASWNLDEEFFAGLGFETYWNSPLLADLLSTGLPDMIYGTASGPLHYFEQSAVPGPPFWNENTSLFGGVLDAGGASNPCFFDFDDDGDLDLFTGSQMGDIKYYENTGTASGPAWSEENAYFVSLKHSIYSAVAIGDANNDGLPDAVVGDLSGNLYYHQNNGEGFTLISDALQGISLGGWSAPAFVDLDLDGDLDIVAGSENGQLHYIENQGSASSPDWLLISGYFGGIDVGTNCVPALVDIDFDEDWDLVCGTLFGDLKCFLNNEGAWVEDTEILAGIEGEQNTAPAFADLDNDGDPDLTLGQYSGVFSYFRNQHFVTTVDENFSNKNFLTASFYPNPFRNQLSINFELENSVQAKISLLTFSGEMIMELELPILNAGHHYKTINTAALPEGIYFVQLSAGRKVEYFKVVKI